MLGTHSISELHPAIECTLSYQRSPRTNFPPNSAQLWDCFNLSLPPGKIPVPQLHDNRRSKKFTLSESHLTSPGKRAIPCFCNRGWETVLWRVGGIGSFYKLKSQPRTRGAEKGLPGMLEVSKRPRGPYVWAVPARIS